MNESPSPLEFVPYDDLVAELKRRFPHFILVTLREGEQSSKVEEFRVSYHGSPTLALGLFDRGRDVMKEGIDLCRVEQL